MSNERRGRGVAYGLSVLALVVSGAWGLGGCMSTYLRARMSTLQHMNEASSTVVVTGSAEEVVRRVSVAFANHGAAPADLGRGPTGSALLIYRAARANPVVATASGYQGVGSAYFVRLRDVPNGVEVTVVGKPTVNGVDLCSEADRMFAEFNYRCLDSSLADDSTLWPHVTGREEVAVVRGVLASLAQPQPAPATAESPTTSSTGLVTF
ncbi:MAG: hypothetical protein R3A52_05095 [Polyangiales bacterium]